MALINFVGSIISMMVRALVAFKLWQWFMFPLGLPAIGYLHMMGLLVFLDILILKTVDFKIVELWDSEFKSSNKFPSEEFGPAVYCVGWVFVCLCALLFGWILSYFI